MGEASVILEIKLTQSTDGIILSQSHYREKSILKKYGYSNYRIASTPYDSKVAIVKNSSGVSVSQLRYSQIIGSLQYLANVTKPDISYYVSELARYTSCPNKTHWEVHIFEYWVCGAVDKLAYMEELVNDRLLQDRCVTETAGLSPAPSTSAESLETVKKKVQCQAEILA
ncbi:hypothetical protein AgCh_031566 [Apium graveolens]